MKNILSRSLAALALSLVFISCNSKSNKIVEVNLVSKSGSSVIGVVYLEEINETVKMTASIKGAKPGEHAIHIHEKGDCNSADGNSAGGHWDPDNSKHGKWGDEEHHRGDIGNISVGEDGEGTLSLTTDRWCIGCGDAKKDILGKAIVVHKGADDFVSQPSGDAGERVACGEINKK